MLAPPCTTLNEFRCSGLGANLYLGFATGHAQQLEAQMLDKRDVNGKIHMWSGVVSHGCVQASGAERKELVIIPQ